MLSHLPGGSQVPPPPPDQANPSILASLWGAMWNQHRDSLQFVSVKCLGIRIESPHIPNNGMQLDKYKIAYGQ
jgi:hypothetical protein